MAVINKIREQFGVLVLVLIGLSIAAFVLADAFGPNSILTQPDRSIGEIAGQEVTLDEYNDMVDQLTSRYQSQTQAPLTDAQRNSIRMQAWDALIAEKAFAEEYEDLGIVVSDDELVDIVQGNNIDPSIRQQFTNPETGEFDKNQLVAALQQIDPRQLAAIEAGQRQARQRIKYENLLLKTDYVTTAAAKQEYRNQNAVAEIQYLYIPYFSVSDSAINITDSDLQAYLDDHKSRYQSDANRSIKYVFFPIEPSDVDREQFNSELRKLRDDFANTKNDSLFALNNSDGGRAFGSYGLDQLPPQLQNIAPIMKEGEVYGPFTQDGKSILYKASDIVEDSVYRAKASHILIAAAETASDEEKAEAKKKAQDILARANKGEDFAALAKENSDDPGSGARGGDLGYFAEGQMVPTFNDAVFERTEAGLINRLVESRYGYHIIKVTEPKSNQLYKIARLETELTAGEQTQNDAYIKAQRFASDVDNEKSFDELAKRDSLTVQTAPSIGQNDNNIANLSNVRPLVMWAYNDDTGTGDISEVEEVEGGYLVAVLTGKSEKGKASIEGVRSELTAAVKNEKKAEIIKDKLAKLSGTLEEIASAYGSEANVYTASDLKPSSYSIASVGYAPEVVGAAFGLKEGSTSKPLETQQGVVVVKTIAKTEPTEIADYAATRTQVEQRRRNRTGYMITEAIKEKAEIEDKRYKFY
jgi:peptidyl-prolyl cis-trans isomerase D